MKKSRRVGQMFQSRATMEGAGVRLHRVFGFDEVPAFDPFLLLDDFGSDDPNDYLAGFPWHPHRGIETVTYMLNGQVEHGDSIGNSGVIGSGDVQWMTAGSGIIHQEMPKRMEGRMRGFQLWVNLPASHKMMDPRYRGLTAAEIPEVSGGPGIHVKVVAGDFGGVTGPVKDLVVECEYLDVRLDPGAVFVRDVNPDLTVLAYVIDGSAEFGETERSIISNGQLGLLDRGDIVHAKPADGACRFLLISGRAIGEPVAWGGPIVMNTRKELNQAFEEYRNGTFIKVGSGRGR